MMVLNFMKKGGPILLALFVHSVSLSAEAGQERDIKEFFGISPGMSQVEAFAEENWKEAPIAMGSSAEGLVFYEFKIDPWEKVIVYLVDATIVGIDLIPPPKYDVEAIGEAFELGALKKIDRLPRLAAFAVPRPLGDWLESPRAYVLLKIEQDDAPSLVERIRFFGNKPFDLKKPTPPDPDLPEAPVVPPPPPAPMPGKVSSPNEKSKNESPSIKVPSSSRKTMKFHDAVPGETTRDQLRNLPKWKSPLRTVDNSVDFDFYEYFQVTPTGKQRMGYRKYEQMKNLAEKGALSHEQAKKWEIMRDPLGLNGVTLLYYDGIAPWEKVVIQVQEGLVWNIDAFPPAGTTVEEIENSALDLREPMVDREDALDVEPGREVIAKESQAERILPFYTPQGLRVGPVSFPSQLRYVEYGNRRVGLFYHPRRNSFDPGNRSVGEVRMVRFFADVPERYPILGISLQKISSTGSFPKSFQREEHVAVTAIIGDSSAEKAGFQVDDILLSVNGREAKDVQQTRRLVLDCPIDSPSEFLILRDKEMRTIHAAPIIQPIPQAYSRRCGFFLEHQAPEAAIRDANVVLEIEPENVPMLVNRAVGYEACKDHERAEADLDRAVELDDTFAPAYANRGLLSEKRGENAQALEDYSKALRLAPNYRFAYRGRARLYRKLGEIEKAAEDEAILQKLEAENAGL